MIECLCIVALRVGGGHRIDHHLLQPQEARIDRRREIDGWVDQGGELKRAPVPCFRGGPGPSK